MSNQLKKIDSYEDIDYILSNNLSVFDSYGNELDNIYFSNMTTRCVFDILKSGKWSYNRILSNSETTNILVTTKSETHVTDTAT